jgi:NDP-mannose synthase
LRAIILAGGKGRRLYPYTAVFPKPLMPLGDKPILEIVVGQLRKAGYDRLTFAVGHLASLIQAYFGDGTRFGVAIDYSMESEPLGTAGPLTLVDPPSDHFLVMNGDILTDLDYGGFAANHAASGAIGTVAVYRKPVEITLGVVEVSEQGSVVGYSEKPTLHYLASTGIYCFHPRVLEHLEPAEYCDLPTLVLRLIERGETVRAHRFDGYWLDIGRPEDYEAAGAEVLSGRFG